MEKIFRTIALLAMVWSQLTAFSAGAEDAKTQPLPRFSDYRLVDSELKFVGIDSDATESFLALQLDSAGRLFAGGREALFVYEPSSGGLYQPRQFLYRFPKDSWIYGIAIRGPDLYVSTHTAVYVLEGAVLKRGDFKRADHWGHWTFFHGSARTPITTAGMVARISPDGEVFEPVARGLRNCCGLAFDANWNLFGNDNDHESLPNEYVPGRLLNITPHAYFSWPRGWLVEKQPWRADLLDTLNPDLGRYVPTGQAYYNDPFFQEGFRDNLLVTEWGKGALYRYPLSPSGATF